MKKLVLTIAIVLAMGLGAFAQEGEGVLKRGGFSNNRDVTTPMIPSGWGLEEDQDGDVPMGSGVAVLLGLGAAYMVAKKRKEE